jgi:hypothetical protein
MVVGLVERQPRSMVLEPVLRLGRLSPTQRHDLQLIADRPQFAALHTPRGGVRRRSVSA